MAIPQHSLSSLWQVPLENNYQLGICPAEAVLISEVRLPPLSRRQQQQALPYALEDQLLSEINELHFATLKRNKETVQPVAVVAKAAMETWFPTLAKAENVTALVPLSLLLPITSTQWCIVLHQQLAIIRTSQNHGLAIERTNLTTILFALLKEKENPAEGIVIRNYTKEPAQLTNEIKITESYYPDYQFKQDLKTWANDYNPLTTLNLLQGPYQPQLKSSYTKKIWLLVSMLFISWTGLVFISNLLQWGLLQAKEFRTQTAITAIYRTYFKDTHLVAPKERMLLKVQQLSKHNQRNNFLPLLAKVNKSLRENPGIHLKQLHYTQKLLHLNYSASSFDSISKLIQSFKEQGLQISQEQIETENTGITGTLTISERIA